MDTGPAASIAVAFIGTIGTIAAALISSRKSESESNGKPRMSAVVIWGSIVPPFILGLWFGAVAAYIAFGNYTDRELSIWICLTASAVSIGIGYRRFLKALSDLETKTPKNSN